MPWERGGGIYSSKPNLQGIPKIFRKIQIIGLPGEELYEVDFIGQYLNFLRVRNNLKPLQNPWEGLEKATGRTKNEIKEMINPWLQGQKRGQYLYHRIKKNSYVGEDGQNYDEIIEALTKLGLKEKERGKLEFLVLRSKIFFEILKQLIKEKITPLLLLHDGLVTLGRREALKTRDLFYKSSYSVLQVRLPVMVRAL